MQREDALEVGDGVVDEPALSGRSDQKSADIRRDESFRKPRRFRVISSWADGSHRVWDAGGVTFRQAARDAVAPGAGHGYREDCRLTAG